MHNACNEFRSTAIIRSFSLIEKTDREEDAEARKDKLVKPSPDEEVTKALAEPVEPKTELEEEKAKKPEELGFFKRLKTDTYFRECIQATVWLSVSFFFLGWTLSQNGPAFPDIMIITDTSLEQAAPLFTAGTVGYLLGSLIMGMIFEKFNKIMLLFTSILGAALVVIVLPWCAPYPAMVAARFLGGFFGGALDTGANAGLAFVWGNEGRPYMQTMHFAYAFGGTIAPLVTDPFLAKEVRGSRLVAAQSNITANSTEGTNPVYSDGTSNDTSSQNSTTASNMINEYFTTFTETRVQYAFLITGIVGILASIPFLYMYCVEQYKRKMEGYEPEEEPPRQKRGISVALKICLLVILVTMFVFYSAVEETFAGLLMTFCIKQLDWTKTKGSIATSIFWACFGFGRLAGIFVIERFELHKLLFIFCSCACLSFIGLFLTSFYKVYQAVWISIACIGLSLSIIFPSMFSWTEERVMPVSSKIASSFLIACSAGASINPFFMGYLMDNISPMWFVYTLMSECVLVLLLYVLINIIVFFFVPIENQGLQVPEAVEMLDIKSQPKPSSDDSKVGIT